MQEKTEGLAELLYKLIIYVPGIILGLSAKLTRINRDGKLTWREGIFQTSVAFSAAYIILSVLEYKGVNMKIACAAAVVCGRFGDEILIWVWKYIKLMAQSIQKDKK